MSNNAVLRFALALVILWPVYIVVKIDNLPSLQVVRILVLVLAIISLVNFVTYLRVGGFGRPHLLYFSFLSALTVWSLVSSLLNPFSTLLAVYRVIDWWLMGPLFFIAGSIFCRADLGLTKVLKLFLVCYFIVLGVGIIEYIQGRNLFAGLVITQTEHTDLMVKEKYLGVAYRVQATFSNPLVFGHYLNISLCLIPIWLSLFSDKIVKLLIIISVPLTIFLILQTGSRASLVLCLAVPLLFLMLAHAYRSQWYRKFLVLLPFVMIGIVIYTFLPNYDSATTIAMDIKEHLILGEINERQGSMYARIGQLVVGMDSLLERPLLGYGPGNEITAVEPYFSAIDNHYLSTALSLGIPGLALTLVIYFIPILYGYRLMLVRKSPLAIGLFMVLLISMVQYFVLSLTDLSPLIFLFSSLILNYYSNKKVMSA